MESGGEAKRLLLSDLNGNICDRSIVGANFTNNNNNHHRHHDCGSRSSDNHGGKVSHNDPQGRHGQSNQLESDAGRGAPDKCVKYQEIDPLKEDHLSPQLSHLCAAIYSVVPAVAALTSCLLIGLLFTRFYYITLIYFGYVIAVKRSYNAGGRRIELVQKSKFWSYLANYFHITIRYTKEFHLNQKENYILGYHPHGIAAFGAVCGFATSGLKFDRLWPNITSRFMVHETSFLMPIMREVFGSRGDCSVNSRSIDHMLTKCGSGNLLAIVVGGLAEADLSDGETLKIVVAKRKGFIKKALIHGANVIPCIAFGENSVFDKINLDSDSIWHRIESKWYQIFKFKHPVYHGRSFLSDRLTGLMPYKRPITIVLGDPMKVERIENPAQNDIDRVHGEYIQRLKMVYQDSSDLCVKYDKKLEIL